MGHLHLLYINSNSSRKDIWNLKQIHKVLFRCKICVEFQICFQIFDMESSIFGHFHIRKSFPKREILKIEDNAINEKDRYY